MIKDAPKPLPRKLPKPIFKRLPKRRPLQMTLTNAFRARNGGVLLCADREENDGYARTEVDKIYPITTDFKTCEVFISGAGPSEILRKAKEHIHRSLIQAERGNSNVLAEHQSLIEGSLRLIYEEYATVLANESMGLIIVVAPRVPAPPILYSTVEYRLDSQRLYCAHGSGRPISDYLADRLYKEGMDNNLLKLLAVFIFREAERKAAGVGMGNDKETRAYYMTTVRGKGQLTNLRENPDATVLITVEGIQDHAIWFVLMNSTSSQSDRVKFWQVGDTISLGAETILINDDRIPKIQSSEGLTRNLTRNCEGRSRASDCYVYETHKSDKQ